LLERVVPSYSGPPRRYYRITPLGRESCLVAGGWTSTRIRFHHSTIPGPGDTIATAEGAHR
jgi:DNA-binding PadR family transcriptional regulator